MQRADFPELVRMHSALVMRVCRAILRDEDLAADAGQDTFFRLWRKLEEGPLTEPAGYARRTAASAALDLLRRRRGPEPLGLDCAMNHVAPALDPARAAERNELHDRLHEALKRLPERQRLVFLLKHEGQLSLSEVAETLGMALPTAKTLFSRACIRLVPALSAYRDPDAIP